MNSRDLVLATLRGDAVPRVATGPLAVHFCAGLGGCTVRDFSTRARALAESVIRYHERFQPDAVWLSADTWVSAEAMGALVGSDADHLPIAGLGLPLIRDVADLDRIPAPDPGSQGRYPVLIEALSRVVEALGREVFVVACFDQFPFSLATALMGVEEIMLRSLEDRPFAEAVMERCAEYGEAYGRALAQAGADLLSGGDSPAGLLGPELHASIAAPFEQRMISALRKATGKPVSLHVCGRVPELLPAMVATGADVLELDHGTDLATACQIAGPGVTLWGNLDPVSVLAQGTPDLVRRRAHETLNVMRAAGHRRFVLSSGCTLAMETPPENLEALIAAGRTSAFGPAEGRGQPS